MEIVQHICHHFNNIDNDKYWLSTSKNVTTNLSFNNFEEKEFDIVIADGEVTGFKFSGSLRDNDFHHSDNNYIDIGDDRYTFTQDTVIKSVMTTDGVTFKFANNKITGVVANSFTAGESFKVDDVTYTNVGGTIYRSSDNKAYSGEFNALFAENATWKAADYWKLEDGKLNRCDGDTGAKLFGIGGLNLDLTAGEVAYEIDGAGYTFQIKNANVKVANAAKITGTDGGELEKGEVSGANVILTTSNGKITVEGGADNAITVVDGEGKELTQIYSAHATYNADQTAMSLSSSASGEIAAPATVIEIDATNSKKSLHIIGNDNANKITANDKNSTLEGGAGNDTLIGGDGKNTFVYSAGNDVITDFDASKDKVKLSDVAITKTEIDGSDLIFKTSNGNLTVKDGDGKRITVIDADGKSTTQIYKATDSANAGWFDEYDNNFVTDEFGLDDITTPVESNFTASKTETFGTANEFNFENSLVPADDK